MLVVTSAEFLPASRIHVIDSRATAFNGMVRWRYAFFAPSRTVTDSRSISTSRRLSCLSSPNPIGVFSMISMQWPARHHFFFVNATALSAVHLRNSEMARAARLFLSCLYRLSRRFHSSNSLRICCSTPTSRLIAWAPARGRRRSWYIRM